MTEDRLNTFSTLNNFLAQLCLHTDHHPQGNFSRAIHYHTERLQIANEFGDKAAERRAHSNLGNAHIFLGEFNLAADHYKQTLQLAKDLGDRAVEAQACYSLGNTYTLLKDYPRAVEFHLYHLNIAQELFDKVTIFYTRKGLSKNNYFLII